MVANGSVVTDYVASARVGSLVFKSTSAASIVIRVIVAPVSSVALPVVVSTIVIVIVMLSTVTAS